MAINLIIGAGAGLVSALLSVVVLKATPLALLLYMLAPLPVLIVSLGWNHRAGLVAAAVGGIVIAAVASPLRGLAFGVATALPAWWLAYLALLGRPNAAGGTEWYPPGRLLAWIAGTAAIALTAAAIVSSENYEAFRQRAQGLLSPLIEVAPSPDQGAGAQSADDVKRQMLERLVPAVPALGAQGFTLLYILYLWVAARIVQVSGRLPRPWPDLPRTMMPRLAIALLVGGVALALLPNFLGVFGAALAGALTVAFAFQGLAAIHDRTRGRPGRGAMLFGLYLIVFLSQGIALLVLTLFGLFDSARGRRGSVETA